METRPVLKFSGDYFKLPVNWEGRLARLLFVHSIDLAKQENLFLFYDARRRNETTYPFPKCDRFLFLLLELEDGGVFTTLRRHTSDKEAYYRGLVGEKLVLWRSEL